jgi:hypothetical protein
MVRVSFPSCDAAGAVVGLGTEVGATVASGTGVASIIGGKVASAAGGAAVGSGAGAEVGVGGAAAPQAITNNVTIMEMIVIIDFLL